jgi:L-threonylcarbamoyladenylate synthase
MALIGEDIAVAKKHLEAGELVAIPTETVYGLAANGLDEAAVLKIFKAKNRPSFNPLILHVPYINEAKKLAAYFPQKAIALAEAFWPGPLTLVLPKKNTVPDIVTAGQNTVAIRIPNHPLTLQLLRQLNFPLAAPSANPSGYISPTSAQHVQHQLKQQVSYILDGGQCNIGIESTIIKVDNEKLTVLRLGGLSIEDIEEVVGEVFINEAINTIEAPGMLASHYAPKAKVIIGDIETNINLFKSKKLAVLSFYKKFENKNIAQQLQLSNTGNIDEAAKNIFSMLRILDQKDFDYILTELLPDIGLGRAINDRLKRAGAER